MLSNIAWHGTIIRTLLLCVTSKYRGVPGMHGKVGSLLSSSISMDELDMKSVLIKAEADGFGFRAERSRIHPIEVFKKNCSPVLRTRLT